MTQNENHAGGNMEQVPEQMIAMVMENQGSPLRKLEVPVPAPEPGQILIKVLACGVCRTDLHVLDGELPNPKLPLILGHEIVGRVVRVGAGVTDFEVGDRIGVPWLGHTCGHCRYCLSDQENLCDFPKFTGYTLDGGYAEYTAAEQHYCFHLPERYPDLEAAPLLCAGLIGYRSYRMAGMDVEKLGLYGFGASAHILAQIAAERGQKVYAFTSPDDLEKQEFAHKLGAVWAGGSDERPPELLDAAIVFAPIGDLVPAALRVVIKGGRVICSGIHMSDIPSFPYRILWEERMVRSVANLTRQDGEEFFRMIEAYPVEVNVQPYPFVDANRALKDLRKGRVKGAAVLVPGDQ
jgi:alcohol dehydrogenase, propanol-preferring